MCLFLARTQVIDENTSRTYWYHEHTGESRWDMPQAPNATIPSVLARALTADPPLGLRDVRVFFLKRVF